MEVDSIAVSVFVNIGLVGQILIRSQDPNNSSDTERGPCLLGSPLYFLIVPHCCAMFFPRYVYLFSKSAFHIYRSTAALQTSL